MGPAPILALLLGVFHTALYVLIRGTAGGRLPLVFLAAVLGAWTGDAVGGRLGLEILRIGDFHVLPASIFAWLGIAMIALIAQLGPEGRGAG